MKRDNGRVEGGTSRTKYRRTNGAQQGGRQAMRASPSDSESNSDTHQANNTGHPDSNIGFVSDSAANDSDLDHPDSDIELVVPSKPAEAAPANKRSAAAALDQAAEDYNSSTSQPRAKRPKPKPRPSSKPSMRADEDRENEDTALRPASRQTPAHVYRDNQTNESTSNDDEHQFDSAALTNHLRQELDQIRLEKTALQNHVAHMQTELDVREARLHEKSEDYAKLNRKVIGVRDARAILVNNNKELLKRYDAAKHQLGQANEDIASLSMQLAGVQAQAEQESKQARDYHNLQSIAQQAKEEAHEATLLSHRLRREVQQGLSNVFAERKAKMEVQAMLEGANAKITRLQGETDQQRTLADARLRSIEEQMRAKEKANKRVAELQRRVKQLEDGAQVAPPAASSSKQPDSAFGIHLPDHRADGRPVSHVFDAQASASTSAAAPNAGSDMVAYEHKSATTTTATNAACGSVEAQQQARKVAHDGQNAHKAGSYNQACQLYTEAIILGLEDSMLQKVLFNRASAHFECEKRKIGRGDLIRDDCASLLRVKPDHYKALRLIARQASLEGNTEEALKQFKAALRACTEDSADALIFRRDTQMEVDDTVAAIERKKAQDARKKSEAEEAEFRKVQYQDAYTFLGIPRRSSEAQIKAAIKKKWLKYHPDRGEGSNVKIMHKINQVKEQLLGANAAMQFN